MNIAGADYGSKLAGTTVIAAYQHGEVKFIHSAKKQDADQMILDWALQHRPARLFLDAPLSLPGVYSGKEGFTDYFYRQADRQLKAMSPMFLGGLTARAMRMAAQLRKSGIETIETYPAALARELGLGKEGYKKSKAHLPSFREQLLVHLPVGLPPKPLDSWHQFDALLALLSGLRFLEGRHLAYGQEEEGLIVV